LGIIHQRLEIRDLALIFSPHFVQLLPQPSLLACLLGWPLRPCAAGQDTHSVVRVVVMVLEG
jgi:hypothetical protein